MATVNENAVQVDVSLKRTPQGDYVLLTGQSLCTIDGQLYQVRAIVDEDVTAIVPSNLLPSVEALLDAAEAYVKALYGIA